MSWNVRDAMSYHEANLDEMRAERAAWETQVVNTLVSYGFTEPTARSAAASATDQEHWAYETNPTGFAGYWAGRRPPRNRSVNRT